MANTIDAKCKVCNKYTYFVFDGEAWECNSCGSYNSHINGGSSETPYREYEY